MADKEVQDQVGQEEGVEVGNTGPVLFSKVGVSPVAITDFDPVGKPVVELLKHLEASQGLKWEGMQILITKDGEGGRVQQDAIVRPGDYVQLHQNLANN